MSDALNSQNLAERNEEKRQDYQQRVVQEKKDLDEKREKLDAFLVGESFKNMKDWPEATRLKMQSRIMKEYSDILGARIAEFK